MESTQASQSLSEQFSSHWQASTADSNLTLHGFRRFKTTHLLDLRYLRAEVAEIDLLSYQLSLNLNVEPSSTDRLGLKHCKKDEIPPCINQALLEGLVGSYVSRWGGMVCYSFDVLLHFTNLGLDKAVIAFNTYYYVHGYIRAP